MTFEKWLEENFPEVYAEDYWIIEQCRFDFRQEKFKYWIPIAIVMFLAFLVSYTIGYFLNPWPWFFVSGMFFVFSYITIHSIIDHIRDRRKKSGGNETE